MRVALALFALVAVPHTAAADEPTQRPTLPTSPAPTLPASPEPVGSPPPAQGTPGETSPTEQPADPPSGDPAYGEQRDVKNFPAPTGKDVVITSYPERSKQNMYVLGGLAAGGVLAGAIGLYFHLDARSASDDVTASKFTGATWTPELEEKYDRAHSSSVAAGVLYGIGGSLLLATAVVYIVTEPKAETMVIHPHVDYSKPSAMVAPTRGGAMVGGGWRF